MDCRHARAGIIPGIVPRERVNDVRAQRYFAGCTADSFCNSFIQTPGEGNIRWNSQIHNRDTGILAHRHPEPLSPVSYTHLRAHETDSYLVCRLLLAKKKS